MLSPICERVRVDDLVRPVIDLLPVLVERAEQAAFGEEVESAAEGASLRTRGRLTREPGGVEKLARVSSQ